MNKPQESSKDFERKELSSDEMLAMAYADGEMSPAERVAFEARLRQEPALADQVAEMRGLTLVTRNLIPPEPEDREWRKIARDPPAPGRFTPRLVIVHLGRGGIHRGREHFARALR